MFGLGGLEPVGVRAGLDQGAFEGEPVRDCGAEPGVGEGLVPSLTRVSAATWPYPSPGPPISFVANPPSREVYERCLRAAGFKDLTWVPLEVSAAGVREFGEEFWDDYAANPALTMLRCRA